MGRRKKHTTLTKIDTAILIPKPSAVSQHVGGNGAPVTTTVNPPSWVPTGEPDFLNADTSTFKDGYLGDDVSEEEIAAEWYAAHVSSFVSSNLVITYGCQDDPLMAWREDCDLVLNELIRLEARGVDPAGTCELCRKEGIYRCLDCVAVQLLCRECMTRIHTFHPFHVIQASIPLFCV